MLQPITAEKLGEEKTMQEAGRRESGHGKGEDEFSFHHYVPSSKCFLPVPGGRCLPATACLWLLTESPSEPGPSPGIRIETLGILKVGTADLCWFGFPYESEHV